MKVKKNVLIKVHDVDIPVNGKFVVPNNVTMIGNNAFCRCESLKEIVIPESVTQIGNSAFNGCESLKEIVIPESVTQIGNYAFYGCASLEEVIIPNGVTQIGNNAFCECESLKEIVIPESVTQIGNSAFYGLKSLGEVVILNGVTQIGNYAFCRCESLKEIVIPESVAQIGDYAFYGLKSLGEVIIPNGVTQIGNSAFSCCQSLTTIYWNDKVYPVRCIDGYCMHILKEKQWESYNIVKCTFFPDDSNKIVYAVEKDGISAHGSTIRESIEDWQFKHMKNIDISEHIARIAQQGYMNANDYRLLTGACRQGTDHFLQEHHLTWEDTMPVEEVLELTKGFYGFEKFQDAAKEILSYKD